MHIQYKTTRNPGAIIATGMSIQQGIPIPPNTRSTKYPFADLRIGIDCLVLEASHPGARKNRSGQGSVQCAAHSYGRRHGLVFRSQRLPDGSVHIWREQ
jgi:hypothetical protein